MLTEGDDMLSRMSAESLKLDGSKDAASGTSDEFLWLM